MAIFPLKYYITLRLLFFWDPDQASPYSFPDKYQVTTSTKQVLKSLLFGSLCKSRASFEDPLARYFVAIEVIKELNDCLLAQVLLGDFQGQMFFHYAGLG